MWYDYYDFDYGYSNKTSYGWLLIPAIILIGVGIWWIYKKKSANETANTIVVAKPVEAGAPTVVPAPQAIPAVQAPQPSLT
ncbi:hypothetical protein CRE_04956 [Caenorhabditis remanei]|uniref:Uncharacterized protein n=1 Tax=Caenorhabditis remanei TaxID=31234 RepID=E3MN61_CAERE|nr:hypothetical protein CRE_04956 [Caenorhabditis remanei]